MRPVLVILAAAILIGLAYHAFASPNTKTETPSFRLQKPKDAVRAIPRCTGPRMFILTLRSSDGTRKPVAMIVEPGTC